ncbi:MAG: TerB family tellurite resistance protein [Thermoplasmatota archaeon]
MARSSRESLDISLLFLAMSAADGKLLKDEMFISEKCALDYGIKSDQWEKTLNRAFMIYFNEGDRAVSGAIGRLKLSLSNQVRKELAEDLLAVALVDENYHDREKALLKKIVEHWEIDMPHDEGL